MIIKKIDSTGKEYDFYIDENLNKNLEVVQDSVLKKGWDYVCIIAGIPGVGKSTLAQQIAKTLDADFDIDNVCFTAEDFCNKTSQANKLGQAFVLDESFADLNANASRSEEFIKIINHIQLIRIKGLFLILVLPDFFSLSKNLAIFRASHLFVVYHSNYERGRFAVFDRETKKELYVKGKPFLNYQIVAPNFRGRFVNKWLIDYAEYEKRKLTHLKQQAVGDEKASRAVMHRDNLMAYMRHILDVPTAKISEIGNIERRTAEKGMVRAKDKIIEKFAGDKK